MVLGDLERRIRDIVDVLPYPSIAAILQANHPIPAHRDDAVDTAYERNFYELLALRLNEDKINLDGGLLTRLGEACEIKPEELLKIRELYSLLKHAPTRSGRLDIQFDFTLVINIMSTVPKMPEIIWPYFESNLPPVLCSLIKQFVASHANVPPHPTKKYYSPDMSLYQPQAIPAYLN